MFQQDLRCVVKFTGQVKDNRSGRPKNNKTKNTQTAKPLFISIFLPIQLSYAGPVYFHVGPTFQQISALISHFLAK